jgi:prophage regulatory protein
MRILRLPDVIDRTGLSRSTIYDMVADGRFPPPLRLTGDRGQATGWRDTDIDEWIASLSAAVEPRRPQDSAHD